MAGNFSVGNRVQAIDELGRWCNAKITNCTDEGFTVSFPGYPGCDLHVYDGEIRMPVPPFAEQERRGCQLPSEGRKDKISKELLRFMSECQRGDAVTTSLGEGTVQNVDPFNRTIDLADGSSVSLKDIIVPVDEECLEEQPRKKRCKSRASLPNTQQISLNTENIHEEEPPCDQAVQESIDWSTFRLGIHQCGKLYQVSHLGFSAVIQDINLKENSAVCWPVVGDTIDKETVITVKLSKLNEYNAPTKSLKKDMREMAREAFTRTTRNMDQSIYRKHLRQSQLTAAINREVAAAFRSRSRRKNFDLGLVSFDVDCTLFGFMPPDQWSLEISYRKDNLQSLDAILGPFWDLHTKDEKTRYVTSMKIKVTSQMTLTGSVQVADYDEVLADNLDYRKVFGEHMSV